LYTNILEEHPLSILRIEVRRTRLRIGLKKLESTGR
jgi:hypothetical protein